MDVESLDHIHIHSTDPESSVAFYKRHFAAAEVLRNEDSDGEPSIFVSLGGHIVIISSFPREVRVSEPPPFIDDGYSNGFGVVHFGLRVADVKAAVCELEDAGVRVLGGPVEEPGITYAYVAAPDGVVLELTQYGSPD